MAGTIGSGGTNVGAGRRRKPLEQKILDGSASSADKIRYEQLQAARDRAEANGIARPLALKGDAKTFWDELAPQAMAAHTLTAATVRAFQNLVETMALRRKLERRIDREGWVVRTGPLKGKRHPLVADMRDLYAKETSGLLRFSLHPVGREMEFVEPPKDDDPFAKFDTPVVVTPDEDADADDEDPPTVQ